MSKKPKDIIQQGF